MNVLFPSTVRENSGVFNFYYCRLDIIHYKFNPLKHDSIWHSERKAVTTASCWQYATIPKPTETATIAAPTGNGDMNNKPSNI